MKADLESIIKQNFELKKTVFTLNKENYKLKNEVKRLTNSLQLANKKIKCFEKYKEEEEKRIEEIINKTIETTTKEVSKKYEKEITELNAKITRLENRLSVDSTNSGTPTSKEAIGKHTIQNNREKSEKTKGAQIGHKQHKLKPFTEDEITKKVEHKLDECPHCKGQLKHINNVLSDIIDIEFVVTKTRNIISNYTCTCCHKRVSGNDILPRGVSYGDNINALALSMMNEVNTPLNKITTLLSNITDDTIKLTEGYLIKLQKRSVKRLNNFIHDLKEKIIKSDLVCWDDTVCKFGVEKPEEGFDSKDLEYQKKHEDDDTKENVRNGIIRFYGNDNLAFLVGHRNKDSESINSDGILDNLGENCTVMHDHVLLNYNDKYNFNNAECNEHVRRYLKKFMQIFPNHCWAKEMRDLLTKILKEKDNLLAKGITEFSKEQLNEFSIQYNNIIKKGYEENNNVDLTFIQNKIDERNLISRLDKFKDNHLLFAYDFNVPFTNNTAELGIRKVKRKLAVSFMFKNANRMKDYATMLSYLETCYRNNINRYDAAKRLVKGNPYTVEEITQI